VPAETEAEQLVWSLLTRDFYWQLPHDFAVQLYGEAGPASSPTKFQIFEVATAAIFARLRPEYAWYVTANRPDGGLDFIGRQAFLEDAALGIAAAVTVGGQCKKRTRVNDIVQEVAGSLARMASTVNPTFFVVALSARLNRDRVDDAQRILEQTHQRHCHILDRQQLEGLMHEHLEVLEEILRQALTDQEIEDVLAYFEATELAQPKVSIDVEAPRRVLAGVPFTVTLSFRSPTPAARNDRLRWTPHAHEAVTLISPIDADAGGVELFHGDADPMRAEHSLELVTYSAGDANLGTVIVDSEARSLKREPQSVELGVVRVVENVRPRFFERPFRPALERLAGEYERALVSGVSSVGVVGTGGSGKSRVCEEFSLERRRRGARTLTAKQAKTLNEPYRVLADLFGSFVARSAVPQDPADAVIEEIERYDASLAERSALAVRTILSAGTGQSAEFTEQDAISAMVLLIVAAGRRTPLVVHLQDLHWCSAEVLLILERLIWQTAQVLHASTPTLRGPDSGVLFILEGRIHERQELGDSGWASEPFEAFLQKLDCPTVRCSSLTQEDGLEFVRRLFEDSYSAQRRVSDELLALQFELIEKIDGAAGSSPFHSLEQVQLLKERGVLRQNPRSGLMYMVRPAPSGTLLPDSVFEAIKLRWSYLKARAPDLALLIWGSALLEDRVPARLFRRLRAEIAPDISERDVDATDILWTGDGETQETVFRHENYFQSIRRFEVSAEERRRVVSIYSDWFAGASQRDPVDDFRWARVLLEMPDPDVTRAHALLESALTGAQARGDQQFARRISSASLDLDWAEDARVATALDIFFARCDDDLALVRELLGADRFQASNRLSSLRARIGRRLDAEHGQPLGVLTALRRRQLTGEVLHAQLLYNDRQPAVASELSARAVQGIRELRRGQPDDREWDRLETEALHSQAVALALSGEIDTALTTSAKAVEMARRSPSPLSHKVLSTYANILLARDASEAESLLRRALREIPQTPALEDIRRTMEVNLGMALVLQACAETADSDDAHRLLTEAREQLLSVFSISFRVGSYSSAGAAALMLGVISALRQDREDVTWFAQAVAAASRGHKPETLWRAHSNLASALHASGTATSDSIVDHARAALEILEESLSGYPQPERSPRFDLIRVPLAQVVSFLVEANDDAGRGTLMRYPGLRSSFQDPEAGVLRDDRGGYRSHEWLRVGREDYVIY